MATWLNCDPRQPEKHLKSIIFHKKIKKKLNANSSCMSIEKFNLHKCEKSKFYDNVSDYITNRSSRL